MSEDGESSVVPEDYEGTEVSKYVECAVVSEVEQS